MMHEYGSNIRFYNKPHLLGPLAKLCHSDTYQPDINRLIKHLYTNLINEVVDQYFPVETITTPTRMTDSHPKILLSTQHVSADTRAVCINLARAGTFPSHICYESLHLFLNPQNIRQDHIFATRTTNESHKVIQTELEGYKIGGDVEKTFVLIPDPMGATGNTIISTIEHYKKNVKGTAAKFIAMHLIVTPEYLKNVTNAHPDVEIVSIRVDRGLSPAHVLESIPGKFWDIEKGLNSADYIVPGGGGFGEIMNNSFV